MVKEAEAHAEEDKKRVEEIDARNTADQLVYSTEKFLAENGEKVPATEKSDVEAALADLKTAVGSKEARVPTSRTSRPRRRSSARSPRRWGRPCMRPVRRRRPRPARATPVRRTRPPTLTLVPPVRRRRRRRRRRDRRRRDRRPAGPQVTDESVGPVRRGADRTRRPGGPRSRPRPARGRRPVRPGPARWRRLSEPGGEDEYDVYTGRRAEDPWWTTRSRVRSSRRRQAREIHPDTRGGRATRDLRGLQAEYVNYKKRVDRDRDARTATWRSARSSRRCCRCWTTSTPRAQHGDLEGGPFAAIADKLDGIARPGSAWSGSAPGARSSMPCRWPTRP